jgi:hypothetical protein
MGHALTSAIVCLVMAGGPVATAHSTAASPGSSARASVSPDLVQPPTRSVNVTVTDKSGAAVTDLQAADVEVKVGGKIQEVVSVKEATAPLRIALLVADGGTGIFQFGLQRLIQKLLGRAEFALTSVIVQPEKLIDYSADVPSLRAGLTRVGSRGVQRGAQLMEAIHDATMTVASETRRPVIVVMRVGGESPSTLAASDVRAQLRNSRAILYVLSTAGAERGASSSPSPSVATDPTSQQSVFDHSDAGESASTLAQVLGEGSKESGGRYEQIVAMTMAGSLDRLADELLHQYQVTYTVPDGVKPGDKLSVSSKRKGLTVRAPSRH